MWFGAERVLGACRCVGYVLRWREKQHLFDARCVSGLLHRQQVSSVQFRSCLAHEDVAVRRLDSGSAAL